WPTLRSCSISPATAEDTQTTAATPSTAATPLMPDTPIATINSAAMISVQSVSPDTGLLEEPIIPTKFPDTAAKKKPTTIMTIAAVIAPLNVPEKWKYNTIMQRKAAPSPPNTTLPFRSRSVRFVAAWTAADFFKSET